MVFIVFAEGVPACGFHAKMKQSFLEEEGETKSPASPSQYCSVCQQLDAFSAWRKEAANAILSSRPSFLWASGLLSMRGAAAQSLRQQNNGQAELGASHPDTKAKNDFSPHGYHIQHEALGAEGSAQNWGKCLSISAASSPQHEELLWQRLGVDGVGGDLQFYLKET